MPETVKDKTFINCTRCRVKYHNTPESISKDFGYKRLGYRYQSCVKCRGRRSQKGIIPPPEPREECCICMIELNEDNKIKINCNHGLCKSCAENIYASMHKTNIIKCPMCRREYSTFGNKATIGDEDLHPILFKIVHRNNIIVGGCHPSHLFTYTSKLHLRMGVPGLYIIDQRWLKKTKALFNAIVDSFRAGNCIDPLVLYMYQDGDLSFTFACNKPVSDDELVDTIDFSKNRKQEDYTVDCFLNSELGEKLFQRR